MIKEIINKEELKKLIVKEKLSFVKIAEMKNINVIRVSKLAKKYRIEKPGKYSIEDLQIHAKEKGGKLLSTEYKNITTKIMWECEKGHQWKTTWGEVKKGTWCRKCNTDKQKTKIEELILIAKTRNGKLLANKYENNTQKLKWICANGHTFYKDVAHIKRGQWCPECNSGIAERKVRYIFETLFNKKFPNTKRILLDKYELDGYNQGLNLAFEYHGEQHYRYIKTWHGSQKKYERMRQIDKIKEQECNIRKIDLIVIPFWEYDKGDENLFHYIVDKLKEINTIVTNTYHELKMDEKNFYSNDIEKLKEAAIQNGGKCVSDVYNGVKEKYLFECSEGHRWKASADSIFNANSWCGICKIKKMEQQTFEKIKEIAYSKNGKCLSETYEHHSVKLLFECEKLHQWRALGKGILNGNWCTTCAKKKVRSKLQGYTIEDVQKFALEKKARCLSTVYENVQSPLSWECDKGHEWDISLESMQRRVKRGYFCKECKKVSSTKGKLGCSNEN